MTISFSGLASGLDTSGWVEALVSVKQQKITTLQTDLKGIQATKSTLTDTRSSFNSLRTALEKLTDAKFGGSFNLFTQNTAKSSKESEPPALWQRLPPFPTEVPRYRRPATLQKTRTPSRSAASPRRGTILSAFR